jgi:hypothetical protein
MSDELNDLTIVIPSRVAYRAKELADPWRLGWLRAWRRIQQRAIRWALLLTLCFVAVVVNLLFLERMQLIFLVWLTLMLTGLVQFRRAQRGMLDIVGDSRANRTRWAVEKAVMFNTCLPRLSRRVRLLNGTSRETAASKLQEQACDLASRIVGELDELNEAYRLEPRYVILEDHATSLPDLAEQQSKRDDFVDAVELDLVLMKTS